MLDLRGNHTWTMAQRSCSASICVPGFACQDLQVERNHSAALYESAHQAATTLGCWHTPAHNSPDGARSRLQACHHDRRHTSVHGSPGQARPLQIVGFPKLFQAMGSAPSFLAPRPYQ